MNGSTGQVMDGGTASIFLWIKGGLKKYMSTSLFRQATYAYLWGGVHGYHFCSHYVRGIYTRKGASICGINNSEAQE